MDTRDAEPLPNRPAVNPAVPVVELGDEVVQIGWSRQFRFAGSSAATARECLALLRQQRLLADYSPAQREVLGCFAAAGLIICADAPQSWAACSPARRDRLRAVAHAMQRCDAATALERRSSTPVAVMAPDGWQALPAALADLAIPTSATPDTAAAAVVVGRAGFAQISALMRKGLPHLAVVPRTRTVRVGPLVVPSRTACLQCLHLARCERDRRYPALALRLEHWAAPQPDPVLVQQTALLAARLIAGLLDAGPTELDSLGGRYWTVAADRPDVQPTPVARHPLCDCWWEPLAAAG
jgi:hypothetical protein